MPASSPLSTVRRRLATRTGNCSVYTSEPATEIVAAPIRALVACGSYRSMGARMLRASSLTFLLALAAVLHPLLAFAQEENCFRMACRSHARFRTCDRPRDGATALSARVVAVSRECSNSILAMQIDDTKAHNLPSVFEIDLGSCISYAGQIGDLIQVALYERPTPDRRRYHFACKVW